jgi:PhzF family phenazine biosynthesis protein
VRLKVPRKIKVYQVDAFTQDKFSGNPAGVVLNADGLADAQMQKIARELNNSETAFLLSPTSSDHTVWIRYFTPITEVPTCGHATIAAHFVRATIDQLPACTVFHKIGIGVLPVDILKDDNGYKIIMTQGKPEFGTVLNGYEKDEILQALGLQSTDLDIRSPMQIVSTGHSKVMIGIKSISLLHSLHPEMHSLVRISNKISCNGYYVYVLNQDDPDILVHGRMFAPAVGIAEDPVTGNANGPLGAYLVKYGLAPGNSQIFSFKAKQGEAMGRPGIVQVMVTGQGNEPIKVQIGGRAIIVFATEIEI